MSLKILLNRFAAVLYLIFSLLMFASAIAAITHQMPIAVLVCIVMAFISAYMSVIRWRVKNSKT